MTRRRETILVLVTVLGTVTLCLGIAEDLHSGLLARERRTGLVEFAREARRPETDRERNDGRNRGNGAEDGRHAAPWRLERDDVLARLGADVGKDALAQGGTRRGA